jgi:hypothetical protein
MRPLPAGLRRLILNPVPRWYPARGSAFVGPPVRMFYASKVRAHLGWWKAQHAPRSILRALKHGVKLDFHTLPQPFKLSPLLVDNRDVDFAIADLQKGDSLGAINLSCLEGKTSSAGRVSSPVSAQASSVWSTTIGGSMRLRRNSRVVTSK